jgi:hypothetical protein
MADIARLTGPGHGQRTLSNRNKNAKKAAERRAAINTARAELPVAREKLQDAKEFEKQAVENYSYYGTSRENRRNSSYTVKVHAKNQVDRLERIAAGNYKNTDRLFLPKRETHKNALLSPAERQAARIQAAKNAREKPKGWLWGGTRRTRRLRKMTRRR